MKTSLYLYLFLTFVMFLNLKAQTSFEFGHSLNAGSEVDVICVGDINGDGLDDVIGATGFDWDDPFEYKIAVFLQDSTGNFPTTNYYDYPEVYPGLDALTIGDVNNDARPDIIIAYADSIGIYFQDSLGNFSEISPLYSGKNVYGVQTGDLNSDGLVDIVACHWTDDFIGVFYQKPGGFDQTLYTKPAGGYDALEIADLNSDGKNDVLFAAGQGAGGIHVYIQNEQGSLNNYVSYFPNDPGAFLSIDDVAIADLNNDGANDIAATRGSDWLHIWYQDTATKLFKPALNIKAFTNVDAINVYDFNCDSKPEIYITHGGWSTLTIWHQDSAGQYGTYDQHNLWVPTHPHPQSLFYGDVNNDSLIDIVSAGVQGNIQLVLNRSLPSQMDTTAVKAIADSGPTHFVVDTSIFNVVSVDTANGFIYTETKIYFELDSTQLDTTKFDSTFYRRGEMCHKVYVDSVEKATYVFEEVALGLDTVLSAITLDSIQVMGVELINQDLSIFPNPSKGQFVLHGGAEILNVQVVDLSGRVVVVNSTFTGSSAIIQLDKKGIYFLTVKTTTGLYRQKVVIE